MFGLFSPLTSTSSTQSRPAWMNEARHSFISLSRTWASAPDNTFPSQQPFQEQGEACNPPSVHLRRSALKSKPVISLGGGRCVNSTATAIWPQIRCTPNGWRPILKQDYIISSSFQPPVATVISVGRLAAGMKSSRELSQSSSSSRKHIFNKAPRWPDRDFLLSTIQVNTLS